MTFNIFRYLFKFSLWQPLIVHAEMPLIAQQDTMNGRFKHFTLVKISAKIGVFKRSKLTDDPKRLQFSVHQARAAIGPLRGDPRSHLACLNVCLFVCLVKPRAQTAERIRTKFGMHVRQVPEKCAEAFFPGFDFPEKRNREKTVFGPTVPTLDAIFSATKT